MEPTLEVIQFFANSANSVRVFEALADGATTSSTLAERTGASRSPVARILDRGDSRDWIDSEGSRYELTHMGEL
jgi:DNA-binding IclR family transcriptional regulator